MNSIKIKTSLLLLSISATLLNANCLQLPTDLEVGECYEKEGSTNLAQAAYERAILADDDNVKARLKLAALYASMQMKKQADALLVNVNDTQLTPAQRTSLATLKRTEAESLSTFKARVSLDFGYDTNINISPISDDLVSTIVDSETATLFTRFKVNLSYLHDLSASGGWFLRTDANLYYQNNPSAHFYDAAYGRVYAGGGYRGSNFSLYLPLFYDRLHYLERDLLQEAGLRPNLDIQLSSGFILNVNAMYSARRYIQKSDQLRDDDIAGAGAALFWLDGKDMAYIKTRYENYSGVNGNAVAFTDKSMYYGMFGGIYSIEDVADLRLNYQFRYGDFEKVAAGEREDSNHDLKFALERDLIKQLRLRAQYRYVANISNYELAEYTKNEVMLGIIYNY
ncbi:MAG: surface lipoprotein assembly modifier [Campylobacterota bacterium]